MTTDFEAAICTVITTKRKLAEKTQADVARAIGVTQSSYSRMEKGQITFTVNKLRAIAEFLKDSSANIWNEALLIEKARKGKTC